jgi:large subunit ribosomal protein L4
VARIEIRRPSGEPAGSVALDPEIFAVTPNVPVMHQVVVAQLAARRAGGHSTLSRAEVRGGGRKPWRQKGSGRARQGSIRAPHWRGGGVAFGPKPRSYRQRTPKKMIQLALRSALSDRAAEGKVAVVESWGFAAPRTREAKAALGALGLEGKVLVVLGADDEIAAKSFRNLPEVHVLPAAELNAYDVLCNDWVVFTSATLPGSSEAAPAADAGDAATDDARDAPVQETDQLRAGTEGQP